ncbi:MAG: DedA family protein [Candidatus Portnoybacteria bacterium]|nr:DedA family protein [Candidatus Portnoybacteria bacterium]MDD4983038.1 DedA family protein [Candidatus Portnoybacteria bacterium]
MTPLQQIILWLSAYKYFALFPLAVAEGPIITVAAGFFVSTGHLNFWLAYLVIVAGDLVGDVLHYAVGRFGGIKFIEKWGRLVGVGEKEVQSLESQFDKRGSNLLFIGKMSHGIGGAFLIAAGIIKMPFDKFIFSNMMATLIKSLLLLLLGFYFGHALSTISTYLERISLIFIGAAIGAFLIYFFYFRKGRNNSAS